MIEMLVVVVIIAILMTLAVNGLNNMGGNPVTAGVATAESMFDEARSTATGKGIRAAVLVAKDLENDSSKDRRQILVVHEKTHPAGHTEAGRPVTGPDEDPEWVLTSRGVTLPNQVFFSETYSKTVDDGALEEVDGSKIYRSNEESSSLAGNSPFIGEYYVYEFNAEGLCTTPGVKFVIGAGARQLSQPATSQPPKVRSGSDRDFGGFVVWRNGRTSVFRAPSQISENFPGPGGEF